MAVFCIRIEIGRRIFECIGEKVSGLLNFSRVGARFVYGDLLIHEAHVLAFAVNSMKFQNSMIIINYTLNELGYYWALMCVYVCVCNKLDSCKHFL